MIAIDPPGPLVSAEQLLRWQGDATSREGIRVADVRWYLGRPGAGRAAYDAGHLPGAIFVDLDADLAAPEGPGRHPLPDPAVLAGRLESLGIGDEHLVVAYDDVGGAIAARLWWMLDVLGHQRAALLDGGIGAWTAAGGELTTAAPEFRPAGLSLAEHWSRVIDREELTRRLGSVVLLDARAPERYRGEVEPIDPASGHIPTAISAPGGTNLRDGLFRSAAELAGQYRALGAGTAPVVTSCGSGVTACQTALALRVAGLPDPILYPGSFSDWSHSGMPVVAGDRPGTLADG